MNDQTKNQIADLIDQRIDQNSYKATLDECVNDDAAVKAWRNYHLIGDVIRGEINDTGNCMISRVSEALDNEPTILAPVRGAGSAAELGAATVTELSPGAPVKGESMKSAAMFAIAASVALFAVLTFTPAPVTTPTGNSIALAVPEDDGTAQSFEAEFGQMLVEHGEFTATSGLNGLVAYAKLVSNQPLGQ